MEQTPVMPATECVLRELGAIRQELSQLLGRLFALEMKLGWSSEISQTAVDAQLTDGR